MDNPSRARAPMESRARQGSGWRAAAGAMTAAICVIAAGHALGTQSIGWNFLFDGGFHLAIVGLLIATRASAPVIAGSALALLVHQVLLIVVLETSGTDGALAAGIIIVLTLPGGAFGGLIARTLQPRNPLTTASLRAATSLGIVLGGMMVQLLVVHVFS